MSFQAYLDNIQKKTGKSPEQLTQAKLADRLGLRRSKLSEILSGKRKPDVPFLKAVYKKLKVDPAFLLDHA